MESELSILRRVCDEFEKRREYPDDCGHVFDGVLAELSADERSELMRQYAIVEDSQPTYGSFRAALDAFESLNPDAF